MDSKFYKAILVFLIVLFVIFSTKPKFFYNDDKLKDFGVGKNKTLITPLHISLFISIIFYMLTCM